MHRITAWYRRSARCECPAAQEFWHHISYFGQFSGSPDLPRWVAKAQSPDPSSFGPQLILMIRINHRCCLLYAISEYNRPHPARPPKKSPPAQRAFHPETWFPYRWPRSHAGGFYRSTLEERQDHGASNKRCGQRPAVRYAWAFQAQWQWQFGAVPRPACRRYAPLMCEIPFPPENPIGFRARARALLNPPA